MTAISVDRLLAMLLGLRYKDIVSLRRTYITLAIVWVVCLIAGLFSHLDHRITFRWSPISISSCLVISVASYTKVFRALSHHRAQIQDHAQQQPGQPNALDIARHRKAVYSALWVQLAIIIISYMNFFIFLGMANVLLFLNSTLNPFLFCWKISEVRRTVKQKIRQAICYAKE